MNPTRNNPHQIVLNAIRQAKGLMTQLASLSALEAPAPKPKLKGPHPSRIPQHVRDRIATPAHSGLPPALAAKVAKLQKPAARHLSDKEKGEIELLLTKTDLSVVKIAEMYKVSRPAIYGLRDKLKLNARRGSRALIAGVRKAQTRKAPVQAAPAPAAPAPAPAAIEPAPAKEPATAAA